MEDCSGRKRGCKGFPAERLRRYSSSWVAGGINGEEATTVHQKVQDLVAARVCFREVVSSEEENAAGGGFKKKS